MKKVYICGTDWQQELGESYDPTKVYSTVGDLKREKTCWKECGIVEIKVELSKWVRNPMSTKELIKSRLSVKNKV